MKFEVYNQSRSNLKVAFFCKNTFGNTLSSGENVQKLAEYNNLEVHLLDVDFLDLRSSIRGNQKEHKLHDSNSKMIELYDFIKEYIKDNNIKISIFFGSGYPWSETFLTEIKKYSYIACYFGDDPEGAEYTSKYYVKNYYYAFCGGIYFDSKKLISKKYLEWGARKSKFIPLGANPNKYIESLKIASDREVDVVYVGGAYLKKILRIFKLKKHFGNRMKLYGRGWNYFGNNIIKKIICKIVKSFYDISEIEELPEDQLVNLYQKSKIGLNMHMSYGPSNLRLYELPMNGVMQVCDCENGLKGLYKIDEEVVAYKNIDEAIKKIEYYLQHDKDRMKIAKAGFERAKKNYKLEIIFRQLMLEIISDIEVNFKKIYEI